MKVEVVRHMSHAETTPGLHGWSAVLEPDRRAAARAVARDVAVRVTNRERIQAANLAVHEQTSLPTTVDWKPESIAHGDAGLAVLCAYLDRCYPDERWDVLGHGFLASAVSTAQHRPLPLSLYDGVAGLSFVACLLGRDGRRYTRLSRNLDHALAPQVIAMANDLEGQQHGVPVGQFDVISGLSGIGAYLLACRVKPHVDGVLDRLLATLAKLQRASASGLPRWFTPVELTLDETTAAMYPDGHLNCGLAHGIPGPLAVMALAHAAGVRLDGLRDAIRSIAAWLCDNRADDAWGMNWPTVVAPPGDVPVRSESSRAAWCYGSPGVARALWLAGNSLDDEPLKTLAIEAMQAIYRRPVHERHIDSPTFCHGVAGLLQITLRFAHDTGDAVFSEAAASLTDQLLAAYEPDRLLGFCSIEPAGKRVDQAGLLDGAAGVALALLAASTDCEPTWDRLFVLA